MGTAREKSSGKRRRAVRRHAVTGGSSAPYGDDPPAFPRRAFHVRRETRCERPRGAAARPPVAAPRGFFLDPRARFYSAHGKQFCPIINRAIVGGWLYARGAFHTSECNGNQIERRRARGPSAGVNHPVNTKNPSRTSRNGLTSRRAKNPRRSHAVTRV